MFELKLHLPFSVKQAHDREFSKNNTIQEPRKIFYELFMYNLIQIILKRIKNSAFFR